MRASLWVVVLSAVALAAPAVASPPSELLPGSASAYAPADSGGAGGAATGPELRAFKERPGEAVDTVAVSARAVVPVLLEGSRQERLGALRGQLSAPVGGTEDPGSGGVQAESSPDYLEPAGDFDGDGKDDLLGTSVAFDEDLLSVSGRRGTDGKRLWRASMSWLETAGVVPVPVGADGGAGMVAVRLPYGSDILARGPAPAGAYDLPLELEAYDGTGRSAWTHTVAGTLVYTDTDWAVTDLPFSVRFADVASGPAREAVVFTVDAVSAGESFLITRVGARVVDGATGRIAGVAAYPLRDPASSDVHINTVPDATGDGLDDLAFVEQVYEGTDASLTLASGVDGLPRWTARGLPYGDLPTFERVGDATGDGLPEVALNQVEYFSGETSGAFLLDGLSGAVRHSSSRGYLYGAGDVDGDDRPDVGEVSFRFEDEDEDEALVLALGAVNGSGKRILAVEHTVPQGFYGSFETIGDADGDGLEDAYYELYGQHPDDPYATDGRRGVLAGGTGQPLWTVSAREPVPVVSPADGTLDGSGNDLVARPYVAGQEGQLTGVDGANGNQLWITDVYDSRRSAYLVGSLDVNGDGRTDLVVTDANNDVAILDGTTGNIIWRS